MLRRVRGAGQTSSGSLSIGYLLLLAGMLAMQKRPLLGSAPIRSRFDWRLDVNPPLEFWFEFASNYSYLSVMRIEQEAARHDVAIRWRPFLLGAIFKSFGWSTSPFVLQTWKTDYVFRDMERQCRKYGLAYTRPSTFPRPSLLPAHTILEEAQGEANKTRLRAQTEEAKNKGIFGAPTFFVGEEMFWGNDRLDDAFGHCQGAGRA